MWGGGEEERGFDETVQNMHKKRHIFHKSSKLFIIDFRPVLT